MLDIDRLMSADKDGKLLFAMMTTAMKSAETRDDFVFLFANWAARYPLKSSDKNSEYDEFLFIRRFVEVATLEEIAKLPHKFVSNAFSGGQLVSELLLSDRDALARQHFLRLAKNEPTLDLRGATTLFEKFHNEVRHSDLSEDTLDILFEKIDSLDEEFLVLSLVKSLEAGGKLSGWLSEKITSEKTILDQRSKMRFSPFFIGKADDDGTEETWLPVMAVLSGDERSVLALSKVFQGGFPEWMIPEVEKRMVVLPPQWKSNAEALCMSIKNGFRSNRPVSAL